MLPRQVDFQMPPMPGGGDQETVRVYMAIGEHVSPIHGDALRLVEGHRIAVVEIPVFRRIESDVDPRI